MAEQLPQQQTQPDRKQGPVDIHVHVVGNGSGNSGCWLRISSWRRPFAELMVRHIGLQSSALHQNLEELYVQKLLEYVRGSSLSAAVLLAQDQVYNDQGSVLKEAGSFHVPNSYVLNLAKKNPEFLAGVSIHPARPDAMDELEVCLENGAALMKILPNCHNINCNDRRYRRFWERMAEARLPLLAHTGGEHTLPVVRREYSDPRVLSLPLECGVNVIAAHCATKSGLTDPEYFYIFQGLIRRFPNIYGDNSAFTVPIRGRHVPECTREPVAQRILHGSDFPVPVYGHFPWLRGFIDWKAFRKWQKNPNVLERDYQFKVAMGFAPHTFSRAWDILRISQPL